MTDAVAELASCDEARERLRAAAPIADAEAREAAVVLMREAIRRDAEPGEWCATAPDSLAALLGESSDVLDGPALVRVAAWLVAAEATRAAWDDDDLRTRHPALAAHALTLSPPRGLRERLERSLDSDGAVRDDASPALKRLRREWRDAERSLEERVLRWARPFGADAYVTRHADRFVALVPAAGFPRRRALVHDVSASGQSLYVEPLEMCDDNNRLFELRARVHEEERRILRELEEEVRAEREPLIALGTGLAELDGLRARARWARRVGGVAIAPGGGRLRLRDARHPLLVMAADGSAEREVVPLDLDLGGESMDARLLLVSGPNMGGKTVLLKTVGLAVLLAHAAFPVPAADGSSVPEIDGVYVDLGDEQSLERGLSTFAAHLHALAAMARGAGPRALVLCDELGAGTDPDEGGALARALIEHFASARAWGVVTTHLGSLKRVAVDTPGVRNGSLEFDEPTLRSRYRFVPDVPGASHALSVAERLGFPSNLLARARTLAPESARALERLTQELATALQETRVRAAALDEARRAADAEAARLHETTEAARREGADRRRRLTAESEALLARARETWQLAQREARRGEKTTRADADALKREIESVERGLGDLSERAGDTPDTPAGLPADALTPGRRVRVADLGVEAEVVSGPDEEGRVTLRRGSWTIHSRAERLAPASAAEVSRPVPGSWSLPESGVAFDVDLRGLDVEEALRTLDEGLDRAVLAGFRELRIVHGIGRGVLREVVQKHLRAHPQVAAQRMALQNEGGRGVTVASLS